jgi:predicted CXXCH cytochrome family protein
MVIQGDFKTVDEIVAKLPPELGITKITKEDVVYTIGTQWKERYLTKIGDDLFILPIQYNLETQEWKTYHAKPDWNDPEKRSWFLKCAGCHATGVDPEAKTFTEIAIGCEACHGPGGNHVEATAENMMGTIVNPALLPADLSAQICGQCHTRGKDPTGYGYPKEFLPTLNLNLLYTPVTPEKDTPKRFWPDGTSKSHHQQYLDWERSTHAEEGVTCHTCHTVHTSANKFQTKAPGSTLCVNCHQAKVTDPCVQVCESTSCIGCHMPKAAKSAVASDIHSHTFNVISPAETIKYGGLKNQTNSCNLCHWHKDDSPEYLLEALITDKVPVTAE